MGKQESSPTHDGQNHLWPLSSPAPWVPAEPRTSPVDQHLAGYARRGFAGEQERNTYCRGSSTGGSSSHHTAPPQHGRRCGHRHRICCRLPSSAWWLCVPRQAEGEKDRIFLTMVSSITQAPLNQVSKVCISEHKPTV